MATGSEPQLRLYPAPFGDCADQWYKQLRSGLDWHEEFIQLFGKTHRVPRLTAFYGDAGVAYRYSGVDHQALAWTPALRQIRRAVAQVTDGDFNCVLANLYLTGRDYMGWHSDDEASLGATPLIASVSLGAPRPFMLRHKHDHQRRREYLLDHGSLLVMSGTCQRDWQHALPRRLRVNSARINLTFRQVHC